MEKKFTKDGNVRRFRVDLDYKTWLKIKKLARENDTTPAEIIRMKFK